MTKSPFKPHFFAREDESTDPLFYVAPRLVVHIDDSTPVSLPSLRPRYATCQP